MWGARPRPLGGQGGALDRARPWRPAQSTRSPFGSGEYAMTPFDLRKPSRPGLVGDKPQSGEPGDTILPLVFFFFFFLEQEAVCVLHSLVRRPRCCQHRLLLHDRQPLGRRRHVQGFGQGHCGAFLPPQDQPSPRRQRACPSRRWRMRRTGWAWWTGRHLPPPRASPAAEDLTFISSCSHGLVSSQSVSYQAGLCLHIEYTI